MHQYTKHEYMVIATAADCQSCASAQLPSPFLASHGTVKHYICYFPDPLVIGAKGLVFAVFELLGIEMRVLYVLGKEEFFQVCHNLQHISRLDFWASP